MSALQIYVYHVLKAIIRLFARLYYPRTLVLGREHLHLTGPNIVVANHPNTLIDPLSAAFRLDKPMFFLANAGLYKISMLRPLLKFLYAIKVERPQDVDGRPVNNDKAFGAAIEKLGNGYSIFVAPEGTSYMERHLRPLRTGTARIALQAEARYDFSLGLRILPIGLTYDKPEESGSGLVVSAGAPIFVKDWQQQYLQEPWEAVLSLTQEISRQLEALMLNTRDSEEDLLHSRLEEILAVSRPCGKEEEWTRSRLLLQQLRVFEVLNSEDYATLKRLTEEYAVLRQQDGLREAVFSGSWARQMVLLLSLPVWLTVWMHHVLVPMLLLRWIGRKLELYIGYASTLKWVGAFLVLPFWYGLLTAVIPAIFSGLDRGVYLVFLIFSGPVFVLLRPPWRNLMASLRALEYRIFAPGKWRDLKERRSYLLKKIFELSELQKPVL